MPAIVTAQENNRKNLRKRKKQCNFAENMTL